MSVDTDQADTSKAVSRMNGAGASDDDDRRLPGQEDAEVSDAERRHSVWLDKNRALNKRVSRITRNFEQRTADQEARHQREMRAMRDEFSSLRTTRGQTENSDDAAHEAAMKLLQDRLEAALEAGKSADAAKIQREMAAKEGKFWADKQAAAMGGTDGRRPEQRERREQEDTSQQQQQVRKPSAAGIAFTEANDWWDDPDFRVERVAANTIFGQLVEEEGADPNDPGTYERVAKRLKKKFAELDIVTPGRKRAKDDDDDEDDEDEDDDADDGSKRGAKRRASEAAVSTVRNRDPDYRGARRRGEQHLSERDFTTMRTIGLNPDNPDHLLDFAKGKREAEEAERGARR